MSAYFRKAKSLFSTTLSTGISTGTSDTLTPASVSGLPTDTEIVLTIDRVDANGVSTPTKMERIKGTISAGNLTSYTRAIDGSTEQAHSAGAVIEYISNAADINDQVTGILVEHNQDGTHKKVTSLDNNTAMSQKDSGGTARNILKITSSNVLEVGNTTTTTKIKAGSNTTNGHLAPNVADDTFTLNAATQTLTNKTLGSTILQNSDVAVHQFDMSSVSAITLAQDATLKPFGDTNFSGLFFINDAGATGDSALFLFSAGQIKLISQSAASFSVTKDNSSTINVYGVSSFQVEIQNKVAGSLALMIFSIKTRSN